MRAVLMGDRPTCRRKGAGDDSPVGELRGAALVGSHRRGKDGMCSLGVALLVCVRSVSPPCHVRDLRSVDNIARDRLQRPPDLGSRAKRMRW